MASELGAVRMDGLLTCAIEGCDWAEMHYGPLDVSKEGKLTLHWADAHLDEYARIHPESAAIIREGHDAATELTRHDQDHSHYKVTR